MARKRTDAAAAKQKRQKVIAIVGLVLLAGLLAIQVPKMMKQMNPTPASPESAAPADPIQTTPDGGVPVVPVPSAGLVEAPLVPEPGEGQLVSFELFETKDPFRQQVKLAGAGGNEGGEGGGDTGGIPAPPTVAPPTLPPDVSPPSTGSGSGGSSGGGSTGGSGSGTAPATAVIAVNGVEESVAAGKDFPADDPLFTLVRLTTTSAEIAIAGGSYQDGAATVTLVLGKTLTLMNTTDGARYEIRLVSVGASAETP